MSIVVRIAVMEITLFRKLMLVTDRRLDVHSLQDSFVQIEHKERTG